MSAFTFNHLKLSSMTQHCTDTVMYRAYRFDLCGQKLTGRN